MYDIFLIKIFVFNVYHFSSFLVGEKGRIKLVFALPN